MQIAESLPVERSTAERRNASEDLPAFHRATADYVLPSNPILNEQFSLANHGSSLMLRFVTEDGVLIATDSDTNALLRINGETAALLGSYEMPLTGEEDIYWRIVDDGAGGLYAGGSGAVIGLEPDYSLDWLFELDVPLFGQVGTRPRRRTLPAVAAVADSVVFSVWPAEQVLCLSRDGAFRWSYRMAESSDGTPPSIDALGNVYVGDSMGFLYCLSAAGDLSWKASAYEGPRPDESSALKGAPVVAPDGVIYQCTYDWLAAISPSGQMMWMYPDHHRATLRVPPALGLNGELYLPLEEWAEQPGEVEGRWSSHLCCVDSSGNEKWRVDTGPIRSTPLVDRDNQVVVGTREGEVMAFDEDGGALWGVSVATSRILWILLGPSASVYIQCEDRGIHVLRESTT